LGFWDIEGSRGRRAGGLIPLEGGGKDFSHPVSRYGDAKRGEEWEVRSGDGDGDEDRDGEME